MHRDGLDALGLQALDEPEDRESYVHRIGRTGRAGRTGIGITFVGAEQAADVGRLARDLRLEREFEACGLRMAAPPAPRPAAPRAGAAGRPRRRR